MPFSPSRWLKKIGGTLTGLLQFSGTTHAGIKLNALTTVQRDALTASNGMLIYNTTTARLEMYQGGEWVNYVKVVGDTMTGLLQWSDTGHAGLQLNSLTTAQRNALTPANGMLIYNTTTNKAQQYVNGAWADVASGSGTLSNWTESAPTNGGAEFAKFAPSSGTANVGAIITPKGIGAFMLDTPDGTSAGGNNRGNMSSDLQMSRSAAGHVASGALSFLGGGASNTASGGNSACVGGGGNTASGTGSAILGGGNNTGSGESSVCFGYGVTADKLSQVAWRSGSQTTGAGAGQASNITANNQTTDATQTQLFPGGNNSHRITLPNNTTWAFSILLVARRTDADGENAAYKFEGCIKRDANAASTAIVGSVTKTVLAEDTAAWDADVDADTTNGSLRIQVTGEAAKTIEWFARVSLAEIGG